MLGLVVDVVAGLVSGAVEPNNDDDSVGIVCVDIAVSSSADVRSMALCLGTNAESAAGDNDAVDIGDDDVDDNGAGRC